MKDIADRLREFEEQLDRFGADLDRWPKSERAWARTLIAENETAARLWTAEESARLLLDELPRLEPSATLRSTIAEIPIVAEQAAARDWSPGFLWRAAFAAFGMLSLGLVSGWLSTPDEFGLSAEYSAEEESAEWETLTEVALATELSEDWQ